MAAAISRHLDEVLRRHRSPESADTHLTALRDAAPELPAVVVTLSDGTAIRGVLEARYADALVLHTASLASTDRNGRPQWTVLDGDVVVPIERVLYWQAGLDPSVLAVTPPGEGA